MKNKGFTLVEMLVVIGVIAILSVVILGAGNAIYTKAKIYNTESDMQLMVFALNNYKDFASKGSKRWKFPVEPYLQSDIPTPENFLNIWENNRLTYTLRGYAGNHFSENLWDKNSNSTDNQREMANCEFICLILDDIPDSRKILNRITNTSNIDNDYVKLTHSNNLERPLIEIIDSWGNPISYHAADGTNFPILRSAGPDGIFYNADDIVK